MAGRRVIPNIPETKRQFITAIKNQHGLLTLACKELNIDYNTYRKWYKEDPEFHEQVNTALTQANEKTTDMAEGKLFQAIDRGEMTGIIFYLKTKGKKRGYIERQEITGKDGETLFGKDEVSKIAKELIGAKDES